MSRVIKFRVWQDAFTIPTEKPVHQKGQWLSSSYIGPDGKSYDDDYGMVSNHWSEEYGGKIYIEQFTGRLDKDGKEIYEGDIVQRIHSMLVDDTGHSDERSEAVDLTGTVVYSDMDGQFQLHAPKMGGVAKATFSTAYFMSNAGMFLYRVLGNIHENPELLKS